MAKKIVRVHKNDSGVIDSFLLNGNKNFTSKETAVKMAEKGQIEGVHVVTKKDGGKFIRSNPNNNTSDNLSELG